MILLIGIASATTYKQSTPVDLKVPCTNSTDGLCSDSASCNITIIDPENKEVISNLTMTNQMMFRLYFNFTLNETHTRKNGEYSRIVYCCDNNECGISTANFNINVGGKELTTGEGLVYVIFLIASIFIFLLCLWGALIIPFKNQRDEEGRVVSVNDLKYLKIVCIVLSYILLMWIFGILRSITSSFAILDGASKLFYYLFWIMFSFVWPAIVLSLLFTLIVFLESKKLKKAIDRGIPV